MTNLTLEELDKLYEMIHSQSCTLCPDVNAGDRERSHALSVLEFYAKEAGEQEHYTIHLHRLIEIYEALRTGNLDPIARELIND